MISNNEIHWLANSRDMLTEHYLMSQHPHGRVTPNDAIAATLKLGISHHDSHVVHVSLL